MTTTEGGPRRRIEYAGSVHDEEEIEAVLEVLRDGPTALRIGRHVRGFEQGVASPEDIDATVRLSFGFRYAAAGPITQKEHSGWDTTCAVAKIIWPDLTNADGPPPVLQRNVDEGRIGFKTMHGFFPWDEASMAKERARYERALSKCLEIFREEGII